MLLPLLHLLCEPPGALLRELVVTRPAIVFALFPLSLDQTCRFHSTEGWIQRALFYPKLMAGCGKDVAGNAYPCCVPRANV